LYDNAETDQERHKQTAP